jgi:YD repeat-containing protein
LSSLFRGRTFKVGLISQVTLTDSSYLPFEYNAARHLTAIVNNQGERIEYTPSLLNGEWVSKNVLSGDGTITQTKQRGFDELGRVIRLLGADTQQTDYQYDLAGYHILHRILKALCQVQVAIPLIALKDSFPLQKPSNPLADRMHQFC